MKDEPSGVSWDSQDGASWDNHSFSDGMFTLVKVQQTHKYSCTIKEVFNKQSEVC